MKNIFHTFDLRLSLLSRRLKNLQCRETLNAVFAASRLVPLIITIDGSNFSDSLKRLCNFLVGRLQVLAMST